MSAALPGGDPLAAALAAGETPSPEMVAAAGEQSALRPAIGIALVAFTVAMLAALTVLSQRSSVVHRIPLPKSIDSLTDRAQELLERIGYAEAPYDTARGWSFNREYLNYAALNRVADPSRILATGRTASLVFWYRTSSARIVPITTNLLPSQADPPFTLSDMRLVRFDTSGRLIEFHSMTPQIDDAAPSSPVNWDALFDAAGLTMTAFHAVSPRWTPRSQADVRVAWEGRSPEFRRRPSGRGGGYHGKPIFFTLVFPWTRAAAGRAPGPGVGGSRCRRDRDSLGALSCSRRPFSRAAICGAAAEIVGRASDRRRDVRMSGCGLARLRESLRRRTDRDGDAQSDARLTLFYASIVWLFYLALEPYVRRLWPELLIGWTRLLSGNLKIRSSAATSLSAWRPGRWARC